MRILFLLNDINSGPGVLLEEAARYGATNDLILVPERRDLVTGEARDLPAASDGHNGLVVLGGVMGVYDEGRYPFIDRTRALIRNFHAAGKPVMGVCLGAQLAASAFGERVYKLGFEEWGFLPQTWLPAAADDPLLGDAEPGLALMQWHGDTFDMPGGAIPLATRAACPNQAFRIGATTYAFQFHMEVTREILDKWAAARAAAHGQTHEEVRTELAGGALERQQRFARRVMQRWMRLGAGELRSSRAS